MEPSNLPEPVTRAGAWKVTIVIAAVVLLISVFGGGHNRRTPESTSTASTDYLSRPSSTPSADAFASRSGAYLDGRERQLYEADPSSRGYTDADRDFLKEHGVSEDEARAAETVLHEHGIDD